MHKDVRSNSRVGKNKANRVVDMPCGEFVRIKDQWGNRKACGVGAGALISSS
jgi:hypothetical protein